MKRIFDSVFVLFLLAVFALPMSLIAFIIRITSKGPALYWSDRIGINNIVFSMPKFRTMKLETPTLATHLLKDPEPFYTPFGKFLRNYSLDELPQLLSIMKGDMSFVGPRPALFNQDDLIALRTEHGIHNFVPGLTGWAQVNGRDDLAIPEKVVLEKEYIELQGFCFDLYIMWRTVIKVFRGDGISH